MENNSTYHNLGVRQYDDILGQFISIDPLWYEQLNWSPYHYCGNDPVNARDPDGKKLKYIGDEKEVAQLKDWTSKIQRTSIGYIIVNSLDRSKELVDIKFDLIKDNEISKGLTNGLYHSNRTKTDAFDMSSDKYGESTFKGGIITLDKSKKTFKGHITLGHEMWHAFDDLCNKIFPRDIMENRAERFELYLEKLQNAGILKSIFMPMPKLEMKRGKR